MQENEDISKEDIAPEPSSDKKAPNRALAIGICLAAAAAVGLGAWALTSGPLSPATAEQGSEEGTPQPSKVTLNIVSDRVTEGSTDFIAHFQGVSGEAKGDHKWLVVTPEQVLGKAEDEVLELAPGDWELEVSPSFNPDGSMSKGTEEPVKVDLNGTDKEQATGVDYSPEVIEAADVTEEAYKKAVDDVRVMVAESDGKVPDKVLAGTLEDAEAFWAKAQEAAAAKKAEEEARKKEAEEAGKDTEKPEGDKAAEGGSKAQPGSQGGGQATSTKPSGGSGSQASAPKQAAHQHSWTPVYRTEPVFGTEPVYENQPVYQTVEVAVCTTCGVEISGDPNQHLLDTGHSSWKSSVKQVQTGTQQVQVGTKQVQTGTTQVLDHYVCSGCGATK